MEAEYGRKEGKVDIEGEEKKGREGTRSEGGRES